MEEVAAVLLVQTRGRGAVCPAGDTLLMLIDSLGLQPNAQSSSCEPLRGTLVTGHWDTSWGQWRCQLHVCVRQTQIPIFPLFSTFGVLGHQNALGEGNDCSNSSLSICVFIVTSAPMIPFLALNGRPSVLRYLSVHYFRNMAALPG